MTMTARQLAIMNNKKLLQSKKGLLKDVEKLERRKIANKKYNAKRPKGIKHTCSCVECTTCYPCDLD